MGKYHWEEFKDGKQLKKRSCTDIPCIIAAIVFGIIWTIVAATAFALGRPSRLLLPENFRGDLCGDEGTDLELYKYQFIPKPSRQSYGICVPDGCPAVGDYVCNNDKEDYVAGKQVMNHYFNHKELEYEQGKAAFNQCLYGATEDCSNGTVLYDQAERYTTLLKKVSEYKCFFAFYSTGPTLKRCFPFNSGTDNATLAELAGESAEAVQALADLIGVGDFFRRGFGEVDQCWMVIMLSCFICCFVALLWVFLLRCFIAPIVYLTLLLILVILILIGYFAKLMADDLEQVKLPGDTATEDQIIMWRFIQYLFWALACIYLVLMIYLLKRIRIAIILIKQGSKAFLDNKILVVVPPIALAILACWILWFIYVTLYIQTIGQVSEEDFKAAANDTFGNNAYQAAVAAAGAVNNTLRDFNATDENSTSVVNTTAWTTEDYVKIMHGINFFGFLWAAFFTMMFGFFIQAMTTTAWYFSASTEQILDYREGKKDETGEPLNNAREKGTAAGTFLWSICGAIKHIGTILWGSFLIALITFIQFLFILLEEEFLKPFEENPTVKCLICVVKCCLAYIARVIKIITSNAFIVCCIKNRNFCSCAGEAVELLVSNAVRVTTLSVMGTIAFFIVKLLIVGTNCFIAYALMQEAPALTDNRPVESGLFPLVLVFILSFIIAVLFVSVLEACTDTVMMCFLWDEENLDGGRFMNPALSKIVGAFEGVEDARAAYEDQMAAANAGRPYEPKEKRSEKRKRLKAEKESSSKKNSEPTD